MSKKFYMQLEIYKLITFDMFDQTVTINTCFVNINGVRFEMYEHCNINSVRRRINNIKYLIETVHNIKNAIKDGRGMYHQYIDKYLKTIIDIDNELILKEFKYIS